jgi:hypothetical protein
VVVYCPYLAGEPGRERVRERTPVIADVGSPEVRCRLVGHTAAVEAAAFSPDGTRVVTASQDKTIRMWDTTTGQELLRLPHPGPAFRGPDFYPIRLGFSADGRLLAFVSGTRVRLWSAAARPAEWQTVQDGQGRWWHLRQARGAVGGGDKFAALFHLRFCDGLVPAELAGLRRKARDLPDKPAR